MSKTDDLLNKLFHAGLIGYKPMFYLELGRKVKSLQKTGVKKADAVKKVAKDCGVSTHTVYRAIRVVADFC